MAVKVESKQKKLNLKLPAVMRFKPNKIVLVLFLAAIGVAGFQLNSLYQNIWPVKKISLQHELKYLNKDALTQMITAKTNKGMWAIDINAIQNDIQKIDWVKSVSIRKVWPDQLVLNIKEHQPVVKFNQQILTNAGTKVQIEKEQPWMKNLVKVSLIDNTHRKVDYLQKTWSEYKAIRRQLEILNLQVNHLTIDEINNWQLEMTNGLSINLGRKQHKSRVDLLVQVFSEIENPDKLEKVDLRYNNGFAVAWKLEEQERKG